MTHIGQASAVIPLDKIEIIIEQARKIATAYMDLTGKPLGITGEVAEFEAARLLNLQLVDARQPGYDAINGQDRIQIKGRAVANPKKCASQRVGSINLKKEWDRVVLVLMDQSFKTFEIWDAPRADIEAALTKPETNGARCQFRNSGISRSRSGEFEMQCLFQRIVPNEYSWSHPSPGRLSKSKGHYQQTTGFGHEDWNFNTELTIKGRIFGYMYYTPRSVKPAYNIAFAVYENGSGWHLAGFYKNAKYEAEGSPLSNHVIDKKLDDLLELRRRNSLGGDYANLNPREIRRKLENELQYLRWSVRPKDVIRLSSPLKIPQGILNPPGRYFARPSFISEHEFQELQTFSDAAFIDSEEPDYADGGDQEFPEGKAFQKKHLARERSIKLVKLAKTAFKQLHGALFCEVCGFNFEETYGVAGADFIEAHHIVAVSDLKENATTRVEDLAMVCSNCHRILHRKRPWPNIAQLKRALQIGQN